MKCGCSHGWLPKAKAIQSRVHEQNKSTSSRILTKQAPHNPESKLLETSNLERSKKQIVSYTRALRWCHLFFARPKSVTTFCISYIPFLVECNQSEKPVQRKPQNVENNGRSHKREQEWRNRWIRKRGRKPLKKPTGAAFTKNLDFGGLQTGWNKIRMRSLVPRERN